MSAENPIDQKSVARIPYSGNIRTLEDISVEGKTILVRGDLDVDPNLGQEGQLRLLALKDTVDYLVENNARNIILLGHIGRPTKPVKRLSTLQLLEPLRNALGRQVNFVRDFGKPIDRNVSVFENVRFFNGETENDFYFAKRLSELGDVYVNDAFGTSHRESASMVGLPRLMRESAVGLHLKSEIEQLEELLDRPKEGFISVVGGAKVETKIPVINALSKCSEVVLVGGALPKEAKNLGIILPENAATGRGDLRVRDIDGASSALFSYILQNEARTIVWNGPMGALEPAELEAGEEIGIATAEMARAIAKSEASVKVVGGGDTVSYLAGLQLLEPFSFVSMGGGAMLEFIGGRPLPALEVLRK